MKNFQISEFFKKNFVARKVGRNFTCMCKTLFEEKSDLKSVSGMIPKLIFWRFSCDEARFSVSHVIFLFLVFGRCSVNQSRPQARRGRSRAEG